MPLNRRDLLKAGVFAGASLTLPIHRIVSGQSALANRMPASRLPKPFTTPFAVPPVAVPVRSDATTDYYEVSMRAGMFETLPGYQTMHFAYESLVEGVAAPAVRASVPGPTIRAHQNREVVVRFRNLLPDVHPILGYEPWTSVHLHGSASQPQFDGYANDLTYPGQYKDYHYPNFQQARTMWYHDHGFHHTAENVYYGLAALYQLSDPLEQSLPIPHGRYDVPLMLSDAVFNVDGSLHFSLEDDSGQWGDVILVNGRPWPVMQVERRKYRFRLLSATIARSWKLSLDSGQPMAIIGTDGGLMPTPQYVKSFRTSSGERYEVIIDFAKYPIGRRVILKNSNPKNNDTYANTDKVMAFDVVGESTEPSNNEIPAVLNPNEPMLALQAKDAVRTRQFRLHREHGLWSINGKSWEDVVESNFQYLLADPQRGDTEIWEFTNDSGGWFHPAHSHLVEFKVLDRNGRPPFAHELGLKDVIYIGENETVRAITRFEGRGKYMLHCHNTIHEDHDMMGQFEVFDPNDPSPIADPLGTPARPLADQAVDPL